MASNPQSGIFLVVQKNIGPMCRVAELFLEAGTQLGGGG